MPAYIIVDIEIQHRELYQDYIRLITPSLKKYLGHYLVRGGNPETLDGAWESERIVVMQFPSKLLAKNWLNDSDLNFIHQMRRDHSKKCNMILCEGVDNLDSSQDTQDLSR